MEEEQKLLSAPEEQPEKQAESRSSKVFWAAFVIFALFLGGGIYAWQNSMSPESLGTLVNSFDVPDTGLEEVSGEAEESAEESTMISLDTGETDLDPRTDEAETASLESMELVVNLEEENPLVLLAPNGGESYCLGDQLDIRWEQTGVENIRFSIHEDNGLKFDLGVFSAGLDKDAVIDDVLFIREAEETSLMNPPVGSSYRVTITDEDNPDNTDTSEEVFSIVVCE